MFLPSDPAAYSEPILIDARELWHRAWMIKIQDYYRPELRYNGWCVSGLDPAEAWVVPSSSTNVTPDKGGQIDQLVLCQSN